MLLLAAIAAVATPPEPARAAARIVRPQRASREEWRRSIRKREIVVREGERKVILRLIELE